jgi:hypothetical protein
VEQTVVPDRLCSSHDTVSVVTSKTQKRLCNLENLVEPNDYPDAVAHTLAMLVWDEEHHKAWVLSGNIP